MNNNMTARLALIRKKCRNGENLLGEDARLLEDALTQTEKERDEYEDDYEDSLRDKEDAFDEKRTVSELHRLVESVSDQGHAAAVKRDCGMGISRCGVCPDLACGKNTLMLEVARKT